MKSIIKKNQLMITALAIMIAIAGYLQFAGTNLEEKYLYVEDGDEANEVDSAGVITEHYTAGESTDLVELNGLDSLTSDSLELDSLDSDLDIAMEDYLDEGMEVLDQEGNPIGTDISMDPIAEAMPKNGEIPGEAVFTATSGVERLSDAKLLKEQTRSKNKETLMGMINSAGLSEEQKQVAVNSMVQMTEIAEKETAAEILLEAKGFSDVVVSINGNTADVVVNAVELSDAQRAQIEDIVMRKTSVAAENIIISTLVQ